MPGWPGRTRWAPRSLFVARGASCGAGLQGLSAQGELLLRNKDRIDPISTGEILLGQA